MNIRVAWEWKTGYTRAETGEGSEKGCLSQKTARHGMLGAATVRTSSKLFNSLIIWD